MRELKIGKNDAGQRLDKFITKALDLPTSLLYKSIRLKKIKVNRKRAEISTKLCEGDTVQCFLADEFFKKSDTPPTFANIIPKLSIVYEDENILLVSKRPGISVHEDEDGGKNNLITHIQAYLCQKGEYSPEELSGLSKSDIAELLRERAEDLYAEKEKLIGEERFRELERAVLLQNVDRSWMEHIDAMDDLKDSIRFQSYAQRDPVTEYRILGADMFDAMIDEIRDKTSRMILSVTIRTPEMKRVQVAKPLVEGFDNGDGSAKKVTVAKKNEPKTGRNDLCPCGSGKKYKKCCGAPDKINQ